MSEPPSDFALLREFVREQHQPAFAALVRHHVDLVYGTALRKVEDCGAAEEIAQNVFSALARKAWQFAPDDSLPAWLHKTAVLESKFWLRGELRRRRRQETAAELGTTMNTPEDRSAFNALVPLLDDALLSLREKDRAALLLRYYERGSLREVGAALGVHEKAAQKRVQSALEKVAEFFKRRGFKTATVAATAAALQHTASTASATLVSGVLGAALQVSPPAILGLRAVLSRFAGLSRLKTAAACAVLVAMPLVWQLKQRHNAAAELEQNRTQLVAEQNNRADVQREVERLRRLSGRLEGAVAQANVAAARAAKSAQAFDAWKKKTRAMLIADEYRWEEESPVARIPKSALMELSKRSDAEPFGAPGVVHPFARELLGLDSAEHERLEERLRRNSAELEAVAEASVHETNQPSPDQTAKSLARKTFVFSEEGDETAKSTERLLSDLQAILGEERWPLVQAKIGPNRASWNVAMHLYPNEKLSVSVEMDSTGQPKAFCLWSGGGMSAFFNVPLSSFLPEGDPKQTAGANEFGKSWSRALRHPAVAWLQEQAITQLEKEAGR